MGANESGGLAGLQRVNRCVFRRLLRADERTDFTLDIDATQIVAEKREARYSYKGQKGYMPMVGHIAENSLAIDAHVEPFAVLFEVPRIEATMRR